MLLPTIMKRPIALVTNNVMTLFFAHVVHFLKGAFTEKHGPRGKEKLFGDRRLDPKTGMLFMADLGAIPGWDAKNHV